VSSYRQVREHLEAARLAVQQAASDLLALERFDHARRLVMLSQDLAEMRDYYRNHAADEAKHQAPLEEELNLGDRGPDYSDQPLEGVEP
jgi:hypothetical protein